MTEIRRRGTAAAVICSRPFATLAKNQARVQGVADLPLIVIDHPLGGLDPAAVRGRFEQALPQVLAELRRYLAP